MANLGKKNGVYLARFRYQGKEYKKSLKTTSRKAAEGAVHRVEDALHRLSINSLTVPDGVDAGDFIVSGGTQEVAKRLGVYNSYVSKCESGERKMDVVELAACCRLCGLTLSRFLQQIDLD